MSNAFVYCNEPNKAKGFERVPINSEGHFILCMYTGIFHLLWFLHRAGQSINKPFSFFSERYPFLDHYLEEIQKEMPQNITWQQGSDWWYTQVEIWEARHSKIQLPLRNMLLGGHINSEARTLFMLIGLLEEDARFGPLFAELQEHSNLRRPALALLGQILNHNGSRQTAWGFSNKLIANGYADVLDQQLPRSEWVLTIPHIIWDAAQGDEDVHASNWYTTRSEAIPVNISNLIYPLEFLQKLERIPQRLVRPESATAFDKVSTLLLRGPVGSDYTELASTIASHLGRKLLSVSLEAQHLQQINKYLGPLATLLHALPLLHCDPNPGETLTLPILQGYYGTTIVAMGTEGGIAAKPHQSVLNIEIPHATCCQRKQLWQQLLRKSCDLEMIAERFHLGHAHIRHLAKTATQHAGLDGRTEVGLKDILHVKRALGHHFLDNLATQLDCNGGWEKLVCGPTTGNKLTELEQRCRNREKLLEHLGIAFQSNSNRGVRALFSGSSGTGKTYAARILAAELGMDLYRVDLASIINKYIGETEKNLHKVLTYAEALDVVLLLDEGDSLLGGRTEVKSSNDRYANLETNFLLQRLETYQGIVVVTTNLGDNIDTAFHRRMDVVVPFIMPNAAERSHIISLHLPDNHRIPDQTLHHIAMSCHLSGGQWRNTIQHACLLALEENKSVLDTRHLQAALASEYRKAGATFPLAPPPINPKHNGIEGFINAIVDA